MAPLKGACGGAMGQHTIAKWLRLERERARREKKKEHMGRHMAMGREKIKGRSVWMLAFMRVEREK